jgi:hypothetical protein
LVSIDCAQVEMYDREHQARKTSLEDNVKDVFTHQTASSDPVVRSFDKQVKHWSRWEMAFFGVIRNIVSLELTASELFFGLVLW